MWSLKFLTIKNFLFNNFETLEKYTSVQIRVSIFHRTSDCRDVQQDMTVSENVTKGIPKELARFRNGYHP